MTADAHLEYRERRHFGSLDGLRALCILAVLWHHTVDFSGGIFGGIPAAARGFLGVDLFFVLSGFLISTLILRERDRNGDISLRKFYMRRTLRIFPVYYGLLIALSVVFFLLKPDGDTAETFRSNAFFYFSYTSNWVSDVAVLSIAWSLATEEQFYFLYPPIEKYLHRFVVPLVVLFILFNQLINFSIIFTEAHQHLEILQSTFTPICLGVLLAYALHNKSSFQRFHSVIGGKWAPLVLLVVLVIAVGWAPANTDISGAIRLSVHIAMTLLLASMVLNEDHVLKTVLRFKPLVRLGTVSYGMYLFHMFARHGAMSVLSRVGAEEIPLLLFFATVVITYIVSELSFRFFEKPFLKLKNRFSSH